jgi:transcription initiation factor IIE alpha subunit
MNQLQIKSFQAKSVLDEGWITIDGLSDRLCVCRRQTQKVLKYLKDRHFVIESVYIDRRKNIRLKGHSDYWPLELTNSEKQALQKVLIGENSNLKTAINKLKNYIQMNFYFHAS